MVLDKHAEYKRLVTLKLIPFSPSQRRGAPIRALAWGEGNNSTRLFRPGERNALAKSKVHQISWDYGYDPMDLLTDIKKWLYARSGISTLRILKQDFNFQKHIFGKSRFTQWAFEAIFVWKKWEELIYYGKSWNIGQVYMDSLMLMNFVSLIVYCVKHALLPVYLFNEAVSFLNYPD